MYYPDAAAATRLQIILIVPKYAHVNLPRSSLRNEDGTKETTDLQLVMGEATCMSQLLHITGYDWSSVCALQEDNVSVPLYPHKL